MITLDQGTIPRDRWGRPQIDGKSYTRVSTLAKTLDDQGSLIKWAARMTAIGMASSPDLVAEVSVTKPNDRGTLDRLVEKAKERARAGAGASMGTSTHAATEMIDRGEDISLLPPIIQADAHAYRSTIDAAGLTPLAAECFVVNEAVSAAGSFDRVLQGPNRVVTADLKTSGSSDAHKYAATAYAIQLATYAMAKPWLPGRGIVDWSDVGLPEPDKTRGLIISIQQGSGVARLFSVDLVAGWEAAKMAAAVRDMRRSSRLLSEVVISPP